MADTALRFSAFTSIPHPQESSESASVPASANVAGPDAPIPAQCVRASFRNFKWESNWRVSTELKAELERQARLRKTSLSAVLDLAVRDWLKQGGTDLKEDEVQQRLHQAASNHIGVFASGDLHRADVRKMDGKRSGSACGGAMRADALIDTGGILALLDRSDRWHSLCIAAFRQLRLPLLTSEAS